LSIDFLLISFLQSLSLYKKWVRNGVNQKAKIKLTAQSTKILITFIVISFIVLLLQLTLHNYGIRLEKKNEFFFSSLTCNYSILFFFIQEKKAQKLFISSMPL